MPVGGQVDDGQASGAQGQPRSLLDERPGVVRAPMAQGVGHGRQARRQLVAAWGAPVPEACYPAHGFEVSTLGPFRFTICRIGALTSSRDAARAGRDGPGVGPAVGGRVEQGTRVSVAPRGCRVVTTSMTARLLLAHQLRAIDEVSWSVVSGDAFADPPKDVSVQVIPIRREFALSDLAAFVRLWRYFRRPSFRLRPDPHTQGVVSRSARGPLERHQGDLHDSRLAVLPRQPPRRQHPRVAVRNVVLRVGACGAGPEQGGREVLPRAHICPAGKIRYVGNGVVLDHFTPPNPATESWPRPERPTVLMVSRLVREKGCADFLGLARALHGQADFVHVGPVEPDQSDALSRRRDRGGLGRRVVRRGRGGHPALPGGGRRRGAAVVPRGSAPRGHGGGCRRSARRRLRRARGAGGRRPRHGLLVPRGDASRSGRRREGPSRGPGTTGCARPGVPAAGAGALLRGRSHRAATRRLRRTGRGRREQRRLCDSRRGGLLRRHGRARPRRGPPDRPRPGWPGGVARAVGDPARPSRR